MIREKATYRPRGLLHLAVKNVVGITALPIGPFFQNHSIQWELLLFQQITSSPCDLLE